MKEHPGNFVTVPRAAEIAGVSVNPRRPNADLPGLPDMRGFYNQKPLETKGISVIDVDWSK